MVLPFAFAIGIGMTLGLLGLPIPWVLASGAGCAGLYMWNTRASTRREATAASDNAQARASLSVSAMIYLGMVALMAFVGGAGYLFGRFFRWARLDA